MARRRTAPPRRRARDLRKVLDWPVEGALFDVEYNALWHPSWGPVPGRHDHSARTPQLGTEDDPGLGARYLPAGRGYGHPVLSIYQADIIMFGTDLAKYIAIEPFGRFIIPDLIPPADWTPPPMVPFWSDFLTGELGWS